MKNIDHFGLQVQTNYIPLLKNLLKNINKLTQITIEKFEKLDWNKK